MAAPTVTALGTPAGRKLTDGYRTAVVFARLPTFSVWETDVKPLGADGGDEIDTTTMRNNLYRTKASRALLDTTPVEITGAYDPNALKQSIDSLINAEGAITLYFPDGTTVAFWGYLKSYEPGSNKEGEFPEVSLTIVSTNTDPSDGSEAGPVVASVSGT